MTPNRAAAAALFLSGPAAAQTLPKAAPPMPRPALTPVVAQSPSTAFGLLNLYLVINNTDQKLICSARTKSDGAWTAWSIVPPGANWQGQFLEQSVYFQCRPPVAQIRYALERGTRYSLLRKPDGPIELVEVTAGRSRP